MKSFGLLRMRCSVSRGVLDASISAEGVGSVLARVGCVVKVRFVQLLALPRRHTRVSHHRAQLPPRRGHLGTGKIIRQLHHSQGNRSSRPPQCWLPRNLSTICRRNLHVYARWQPYSTAASWWAWRARATPSFRAGHRRPRRRHRRAPHQCPPAC